MKTYNTDECMLLILTNGTLNNSKTTWPISY